MCRCSKIKKLFPVELLKSLQNLEEISVSSCEEMEEIIASEENHKGEGTTFILPKLKSLSLELLPKLKSICSGGVMISLDSLQRLQIWDCPKLKRIPLSLPLLENGQPPPPPFLKISLQSRGNESQAYTSSDNGGRGCGCAFWLDNLIDYGQFQSVGQDLYVRVSASKSELKDKLRMELAAVIRTLLSCAFRTVYCQLLHLQKPQKVER
ncbi:hypothetical protein QUC31_001941 [Theobroma cacao]